MFLGPHRSLIGSQAAAAPAFTPASVTSANLKFWGKPNLGLYQDTGTTTPVTTTGDVVGHWVDQSGIGNDVTQASATVKPTWTASVKNSLGMVTPDGINDSLRASPFTGVSSASSGCTVFVVLKTGSDITTYHSFLGLGAPGAPLNALDFRISSSKLLAANHLAGSAAGRNGVTTLATSTVYIVAATFGPGVFPTIYLNGATDNGTTIGSTNATLGTGTYQLNVAGNVYSDSGQFSNHLCGEVLTYDNIVNSTEIGKVFTYLNAEWAVY